MNLSEFLLARIAEDEADARSAESDEGGRWIASGPMSLLASFGEHGDRMGAWSGLTELRRPSITGHIARHDPARVLAECEAKRRIVAKLLATRHEVVDGDCWFTCAAATEERDGGTCCDDSRRGTGCDCGRDSRVESYLRLLALPWTDHPDYDPEWHRRTESGTEMGESKLSDVTDGDRYKAGEIVDTSGDLSEIRRRIAAALAEEREKARAPFLALADREDFLGSRLVTTDEIRTAAEVTE